MCETGCYINQFCCQGHVVVHMAHDRPLSFSTRQHSFFGYICMTALGNRWSFVTLTRPGNSSVLLIPCYLWFIESSHKGSMADKISLITWISLEIHFYCSSSHEFFFPANDSVTCKGKVAKVLVSCRIRSKKYKF